MRFVFGLVLIIGLGLAGSAVYLVQGYINQNASELDRLRAEASQQVTFTPIYVAAVPLRYGQRLTPEDVRLARFPSDSLPEGIFTDPAALFPNDNATPRTILRAIEPNEPLLQSKMTQPGQDAGITTILAPGMRAFTIAVDAQSGVSGFVQPGDRVDIYWTGRTQNDVERTLRLDTSVKVIAVDQSADQDTRETRIARTITVQGTTQQVANFQQAQASGRLSLALVGVGDESSTDVQDVDIRSVLGLEEVAPVVEQEERRCFITVRQGTEDVQKEIRCAD